MIRIPVLLAAALVPLSAADIDISGIRRATFHTLEQQFDKTLASTPAEDPFDLLGGTRATYVEGIGAVITAEVSLTVTPAVTPFRQEISKKTAEQVWNRKVKALPELRRTMREMLVSAAKSLPMVPEKEQLVLAVRLLYLSWEKTEMLPGQIVMRGERGALARGGSEALAATRVEEF